MGEKLKSSEIKQEKGAETLDVKGYRIHRVPEPFFNEARRYTDIFFGGEQ